MPTRIYRPMRAKTTLFDHVIAHEWKFALVAYVWTALGAVLCWTWVSGEGPATVITELGSPAAGIVSVAILTSGLAVTAAIVWRGDDRTAWVIELTALPLGASAWIAYAAVTDSLIWRILATGYILGCALRLLDAYLTLRPAARQARAVIAVTE